MKRQAQAPSARLFFVDDAEGTDGSDDADCLVAELHGAAIKSAVGPIWVYTLAGEEAKAERFSAMVLLLGTSQRVPRL